MNFIFYAFSEKRHEFAKHALSGFIKIAQIFAFSDELAKRAYCAKRVHLLWMNIHLPEEIPMAKWG